MKDGYRLPFGKYKGERLADVPTDYVEWLARIAETDSLRSEVDAELDRRAREEDAEHATEFEEPPPPTAPPPLGVREIIVNGFRVSAMRTHADRGGSDAAMRQLLAAREWLIQVAGLDDGKAESVR